mgnify:CR=1 FL=1
MVECSGRWVRQIICFNPRIKARVRLEPITHKALSNLRLRCPTFSPASSNNKHNKQVAQCSNQCLQGRPLVGLTTTRRLNRYLARLSRFSNDKHQHKCLFSDNKIIKTIISSNLPHQLHLWREAR